MTKTSIKIFKKGSFKNEDEATTELESLLKGMVDNTEVSFNIPKGTLTNIFDEDDWSFIMKVHSLLELALTDSLNNSVPYCDLGNEFSNLPLSQHKIGKIYFAEKLNLISREQRIFIEKFSNIRNMLIHDIKKLRLTLKDYYKKIQESVETAVISYVNNKRDGRSSTNNNKLAKDTFRKLNPKIAIFYATMTIITSSLEKSKLIQNFVENGRYNNK